MCKRCEWGDTPVKVTAEMLEVAALVDEIYATNWGAVGGPLHIHLDDNNLEDHWFADDRVFVEEEIERYRSGRHDQSYVFGDADAELVRRCYDALGALPDENVRQAAVNLGHNLFERSKHPVGSTVKVYVGEDDGSGW